MKAAVISFTLFFILVITRAQAPLIQFAPVLDNDGKSLKKINAITQDSLGYMWFAGSGANCLYKFDGVTLTRYQRNSENPNALSGGGLETVCAGRNGEIWIGVPEKGLDVFSSLTGKWKHYHYDKSNPNDSNGLGARMINVIMQDRKGRVWLGTTGGLDVLDPVSHKFTHFRSKVGDTTSLSDNMVRSLYEDSKGVIWVGTGFPWSPDTTGGLNRLEADGKFKRYLHLNNDIHSLANNKVASIFEDSKGNFWVGTAADGLNLMDRDKGTFQRFPYDSTKPDQLSRPPVKRGHNSDYVSVIREDGSGALWIGSYEGGLNRYDPQTKKISHYGADDRLPDSQCWSSYVSRDGVFWVSTEEGGLYRVDPYIRQIPSVQFKGGTKAMLEDEIGDLWAGSTQFGFSVFNTKNELLKKNEMASHSFGEGVWTFLKDTRGTFWIGTDKGVGILNPITDSIIPFGPDSVFKNSGNNKTVIIKIIEDKSRTIWFATSLGLIHFIPDKGIFQTYVHNSQDSLSLPNIPTSVVQDKDGTIWVSCGAEGGVARLNPTTGKFTIYLRGKKCLQLLIDSKNTIWVLTGEGLFQSNPERNQFLAFFDPVSPYSKQMFTGATEDHEGNIWFHTLDFLLKLNEKTGVITCYDNRYGNGQASFFDGGVSTRRDGRVLVGNGNGFFSFYPNDIFVPSTPLHLRLTQFELNYVDELPSDSGLLRQAIEFTNKLALNYTQNNIGFAFSAFDYRDPNGVHYFTRLDGFDNIWREIKGEKIARYYNLSPGHYVFRVKAFLSGGKEEEKIISIEISPPFWKTRLAYFFYALATLSIFILIYRAQKKRIIQAEKEKTKERELARAKEVERAYEELKRTQAQLIQSEKMASLGELTAGIAHEIQNPLNFVNNFSEVNTELIGEMKAALKSGDMQEALTISEDIEKNLDKIGFHGKRADSIVKGMLQHSRGGSGNKELTDINALCDEWLRLAYHGMRAREKDFNVRLKTEFDPTLKEINVDRQDLGRVILNIFNNALYALSEKRRRNVSGYDPELLVKTMQSKEKVVILIRDNGIGIPQKIREKIFQPFFTTKPTGQGTGLGLSLSFDSIKAMGGEIRVESKEDEWTEFTILLGY